MDEIGTTDIADFALPGSGEIKLSQIKSEFNKGNNLKAYYGVASGIPSSGTIKVTDFYGKSAGGGGSAPSGNYSGTSIMETGLYNGNMQTSIHIWTQAGSGSGSYYPMPSRCGVSTLTAAGADPTDVENQTYWPVANGMTSQGALDYWNQYRAINLDGDLIGGKETHYGSWSIESHPKSGGGSLSFFEFSVQAAGKTIARHVDGGRSWSISLAQPTRDGLPDELPVFAMQFDKGDDK